MTEKKTEKKTAKPPKKTAEFDPKTIKVRLTFTRPVLGTSPADPEIYSKHIGKNSADKEKVKDELKNLPQEELEEKGMTVFRRSEDDENVPIFLDYQIKGFIKEMFGIFVDNGGVIRPTGCSEISFFVVKRRVDNYIFVYPREIPIKFPEGQSSVDWCKRSLEPDHKNDKLEVRPLRAETMKGERVALACSEKIPKGSQIEFEVEVMYPGYEKFVRQALDYGKRKGIGQWRNSGMGRFEWEEIQ
jgi:hypothetical protein